ncbi:unnamed protein product [Euphydryas editha]|uniref:Uncharacterized protein n=1 Tax=Euphydryas editha TaxID=104508 RepID=A0AAU9TA66_EUPED|nr:unnamed protein product [Euphydryas editha]
MGKFKWLLVEWIGEQRTHAYEVVNSFYLISQKADLYTGKIVFLRHNRSKNEAREAKVLKISNDKHHITRLKLILIKQQEQEDVYRIENFFNITVDKMRTGPVVPIGSGIITIPAIVYEAIDWNDYSKATITLLETFFPKKRQITTKCALERRPTKKKMFYSSQGLSEQEDQENLLPSTNSSTQIH